MLFVNATPHALNVKTKDGELVEFPTTEYIARVASSIKEEENTSEFNLYIQEFGDIEGLPAPQTGIIYIVSAMVLSANSSSDNPRKDLVAPATSHKDVTRNDKGHITSVPGFVI